MRKKKRQSGKIILESDLKIENKHCEFQKFVIVFNYQPIKLSEKTRKVIAKLLPF